MINDSIVGFYYLWDHFTSRHFSIFLKFLNFLKNKTFFVDWSKVEFCRNFATSCSLFWPVSSSLSTQSIPLKRKQALTTLDKLCVIPEIDLPSDRLYELQVSTFRVHFWTSIFVCCWWKILLKKVINCYIGEICMWQITQQHVHAGTLMHSTNLLHHILKLAKKSHFSFRLCG